MGQNSVLICIDISNTKKGTQLAICVIGTLFFYLLYGYLQELIFRDSDFKFGWFLTLVQFIVYTLVSLSDVKHLMEKERQAPIMHYIYIAVFMVSSMGLSNSSLSYINYPTQVLIKSCKVIPVMIGGRLFFGKRYSLLEVLSAVLLSFGLCQIALGNVSENSISFNGVGLLMLMAALFADSIVGNTQEKALMQFGASTYEMSFYSHMLGSVILLFISTLSGQLLDAVAYTYNNPRVLLLILVFSLSGYLGVTFVLMLIKKFGAFLTISVTSCRKFVTILLSFLLFPKPITLNFIIACCLILTGIGCQVYSKNADQIKTILKLRRSSEPSDKVVYEI